MEHLCLMLNLSVDGNRKCYTLVSLINLNIAHSAYKHVKIILLINKCFILIHSIDVFYKIAKIGAKDFSCSKSLCHCCDIRDVLVQAVKSIDL